MILFSTDVISAECSVAQVPVLVDFPFSALLSSPNVKRARSPLQTDAPNKTPLIIHIPKIYSLLDVYGGDFLEALRDAIVGTIGDILVILTTDQESKVRPDYGERDFCYVGCGFAMDDMGCVRTNRETPSGRNRLKRTERNSGMEAICMAPIGNRSQRILFDTHKKLEESYEQENTRLLQRSIRRISVEHRNLPIVQPFADWSFLEGTLTQKKLVKQELREKEVVDLVCALHRDSKEEHIKEAILRIGLREKALDDWCDSAEDEARASKWSTFPTQAQSTIRQIEKNYKFKWEQQFLDLLINPDDVEEGWSQIALEPDVKEAIVQLIHQPSNTGMHAYGILKHGRVGGALLYGPPGTGKTHLARVLARESKAIMICASAADIVNMYVGETEKAIQGLFSLGRMLSPCTIFIDEADALFRSRKSDDRGWERSQMNQLLYEMDGLKKSKSPPFVLLATNFPRELDHAVLRRVPSRIHIGLPSPEARRQIFQICFADEMLHPDVNLCHLVEKSRGYSGSDIQTVCVQAALICDTIVGDDDARRILKQWHFEKAFQRSAPTVSKTALTGIRAFAKEFDPATLDYMGQEEDVGHMPSKISCLRCEERKNTRGRNYQPRKQETPLSSRPNGLDLGLESLETNSTEHGRSTTAARKAEEVDSQVNGAGLGELEEPYQYTPLKPDSKQIRVLSIQPKKGGSDVADEGLLRCTLTTVDLDDWTMLYREVSSRSRAAGLPTSPKYRLTLWHYLSAFREGFRNSKYSGSSHFYEDRFHEFWMRLSVNNDLPFEGIEEIDQRFNWGDYIALSYVWGDPRDRHDILLNGHRFSVTSNLYQALLYLRDSVEVYQMKLHVWADAICINQDNLAERAAEVKKMGVIYSECLSVRAWLGHPSPEVALELPSLREFLNSISDIEVRDFGLKIRWERVTDMEAAYSLWTVSSSLFSTPYWERIWIIQEVALAPSVLFYYGKEVFTTEETLKLGCLTGRGMMTKKFTSHSESDTSVAEVMLNMSRAFHRLLRLRPPYDSDFLEKPQLHSADLVRFAQNSKAMDQRDKAFGLLALLPESIATRIHPNYDPSFTVQDTFTMFSKACFEAEGSLCFLARVTKRPSLVPNLPSWALDLEAAQDISDFTLTATRHRIHGANLDMPMKELSFSENNRLLFCDGVIVDAVASLGAVQVWSPELGFDLFSELQIGSDRSSAPVVDRDWKLALARVLIQDSYFELSESPSVLDIPWVEQSEVDYEVVTGDIPYYHFSEEDRYWPRFHQMTPLNGVFHRSLYGNEDFDIGGKPLKSYFTSTDTICPDPAEFMELAHDLVGGLTGNRLFTSRDRLLGTAPQYARLGDKIAILSSCDMPMVIRPNGKHYEVVGSCFVEGLMKGEAARGIKQGQFQIETLSLC